jgi:hypothetical protein
VWYKRRKSFATFLYNDMQLLDRSNWWLPSTKCLEEWIESSFFRKKLIYQYTNKVMDRSGWFVYALRRVIGTVAPQLYIRSYPERAVIVAQAVSGKDPLWVFSDAQFAGIDGNTYEAISDQP